MAIPEFLEAPEVGGIVLEVLHLNPNHSSWRRTFVVVARVANREKVGREGRVEGLGQDHKPESHLFFSSADMEFASWRINQ